MNNLHSPQCVDHVRHIKKWTTRNHGGGGSMGMGAVRHGFCRFWVRDSDAAKSRGIAPSIAIMADAYIWHYPRGCPRRKQPGLTCPRI